MKDSPVSVVVFTTIIFLVVIIGVFLTALPWWSVLPFITLVFGLVSALNPRFMLEKIMRSFLRRKLTSTKSDLKSLSYVGYTLIVLSVMSYFVIKMVNPGQYGIYSLLKALNFKN